MNINLFAETFGKRNTFYFVLIDLKREIKEHIIILMKTKTHILTVFRKQKHSPKGCNQLKTEKIEIF